ncbi:hypothetical protein SK128_011930 [Halocaridina rubra]|uniref:Uncharacterized protein n=1 Tax=Halocaridina rubra TaxID=373956 RepID=A0AAN9A8B1_HALRR
MWLGLAAIFISALLGLVVGRITDLLYGYLRTTLVTFLLATCGCCYWFYLISSGIITNSHWQIYPSVIGIFSFGFATSPLFVELAVEIAFPCPEQVVTAFLLVSVNMFSSMSLFAFMIVNSGELFFDFMIVNSESFGWVTYCLMGFSAVGVFPLLAVKEVYARSNIDKTDLNLT